MDTFTANHLAAYAATNCYDDERNDFLLFVWTSDADELDYFKYVGWFAALGTFRRQRAAAR